MVIVMDIPFSSIVAFEVLLAGGTIFHHSNLRLPPRLERALSQVMITTVDPLGASPRGPSGHRFQLRHTVQLLGPAVRLAQRATARSLDMTIGVEKRPEQDFLRLLARPFRLKD